jgi:prevent-host-death family protein
MRRLNLNAARKDFAHLVNQVAYGAEIVLLTRRNRDLAVLFLMKTFIEMARQAASDGEKIPPAKGTQCTLSSSGKVL